MRAGKSFWKWGVPSPASIRYCDVGIPVIGSGGLRNGLDLFKALLMGASAGGFARTLLKGADVSEEQIQKEVSYIIRDFKIGMFLTGSRNVKEIREARHFINEPLKSWLDVYGK